MFYFTKCEFLVFSAFYGMIFGSFINVLIYRIPKMIFHEYRLTGLDFFRYEIKRKLFSFIISPKLIRKIKRINRQDPKPQEYNLFSPPSSCPNCRAKIKFFDNIPIISYLILIGKCRNCSSPISIRYLLVELVATLGSIVIAYLVIADFQFASPELIIKLIFINEMNYLSHIFHMSNLWKKRIEIALRREKIC